MWDSDRDCPDLTTTDRGAVLKITKVRRFVDGRPPGRRQIAPRGSRAGLPEYGSGVVGSQSILAQIRS